MVVTTISIVVLLLIVAIVGGVRFTYSLIGSSHITMQTDIKTKALDVFVYLGIAISLITSITNFLQIIFAAVDRKFVDVLSGLSYVDTTQSDVRFAIASLVVMFPIYIGLSWYVSKDIEKFLYKQDIAVRKIMVYCTLFFSVLTLIGTLVSIIYYYLGGELSIRFAVKALSVFVVALTLFSYYYYSLRRNYSVKTAVPVLMTGIASLVVIASIVWSVSIIGTPAQMRAKKIDSTRLSDISGIQQELFNRVQMTDKLPLTLPELDNAFQGYKVPIDPITQDEYIYKIIEQPVMKMNYTSNKKEMTKPAIFELCAIFETTRELASRGQAVSAKDTVLSTDSFYSVANYYYDGDVSPFWNHGAGLTCFRRVISPEMYYGR